MSGSTTIQHLTFTPWTLPRDYHVIFQANCALFILNASNALKLKVLQEIVLAKENHGFELILFMFLPAEVALTSSAGEALVLTGGQTRPHICLVLDP